MNTTNLDAPSGLDSLISGLLTSLTLEDKVMLLTGKDFWTTWPIEKIGLRSMVLSDGPAGVRGEVWDERSPSLNLPSGTALASSWDRSIASRYGVTLAAEARRKGVDIVLGPTINLHRSPLGGRHFEAFSEDPVLTADLAAAYVAGIQSAGVGATPKHYIANDFETERFTANVEVDERTLREVYLLAFEKAIVESRAWLVMSAYNSINGATATENDLLETPLNSEWGFDGVVVSDWTAVRSLHSATHSQDLVMPGPDGPWGADLVAAVRAGDVAEAAIDRKVMRLLHLAARVGALAGIEHFAPTDEQAPEEDAVAFARHASAEGTVLLRNEGGVLPLEGRPGLRIAVLGDNARLARTQGGGSATVLPAHVVSPLEGIQAAFPDADVQYRKGAVVHTGMTPLPLSSMTNPVTGAPGARVRFLGPDGGELFAEDRLSSAYVYFGGDAPVAESDAFEFETTYTPDETGEVNLGFAGVGLGSVFVDGVSLGEYDSRAVGDDLGAALLAPPSWTVPVAVTAGESRRLRMRLKFQKIEGGLSNAFGATFGTVAPDAEPRDLIDDAVAAARDADLAVVVVGTTAEVESEGYDRQNLRLPGEQDALVHAVAAVNPHTVVVVNSGSPVELPWKDEVAAILIGYFGGQEFGNALADVLSGSAEPGGRLPTTWPARQEDVPVLDVTPHDGVLRYDEGIHIGYRAWLKQHREPAFWFGEGLGYTQWAFGELALDALDGDTTLTIAVTNTGDRFGKQVLQVYAAKPDSTIDRPAKWLIGHEVVRLPPGQSTTVRVPLPRRSFAHWDHGWQYEEGDYDVILGTSVAAEIARTRLSVGAQDAHV